MTLLAIDTATFTGAVAVTRDGRTLAERQAEVTAHSETLMPMVRGALADAGIGLGDLSALACGRGPGTFTGLRIGMATAKALCLASGRPLVCVSSLAALALNAPAGFAGLVVPCIDARRREVFAGFYRVGAAGVPEAEAPEAVLRPEALRDRLRGRDALLVGDGALAYRALWGEVAVASEGHALSAARVAELGARRLAAGESDDLASVAPAYLRGSDAERGRG